MNTRPRVGIDLAPASRGAVAPGTARHVIGQARALFALDVDWEWVPLVESDGNPLWPELQRFAPEIVPGRRLWTRATLGIGAAWQRRGCALGFATAYFVPWRGLPVVANFFDSNLYEHGRTWIRSGRRWNYYLNRTLSTFAVHRAERLFINSHYCRNYLLRLFPWAAEKFVVASCGITPPRVAPPQAPEWAARLDRPFFLYVGVFSDNKNQPRLLDAWAQLQREHPDLPALVLIGPCPADYDQQVIQPRLRVLPRPAEVLHTALVSDDALAWAYQHALAYVQPSIAEGFGLPVVEAMSYGLPVACSQTTSLPEVAGDAAIYFDPFDPASIAVALRRLWKDEALRRELATLGPVRSASFTWQKNAQIVAQTIESLLR
ncbi:MAG: hypothetical protein QOE70_984 [Chthoniobacter sp.]|nr:hypothetical protein [Chthoniobacter sp.]